MAVTVTLNAQLKIDKRAGASDGFANVVVGNLSDGTETSVSRVLMVFPLSLAVGGSLVDGAPTTITITQ